MSATVPIPVHFAVDHPEEGQLTVFWDDGLECVYQLADLRKACPCASCREIRRQLDEGSGLGLMTQTELNPSTEISDIVSVGRYAVQFTWQDGHNTGIYTYEFLRELCKP